jgi:hypothetical protein
MPPPPPVRHIDSEPVVCEIFCRNANCTAYLENDERCHVHAIEDHGRPLLLLALD